VLGGLQPNLIPFLKNRSIYQLNEDITTLTRRGHRLSTRRIRLPTEHGRVFREAWIAGVKKYYPAFRVIQVVWRPRFRV